MLELIILLGGLILLILLLFGGKYLHHYLYPDRTTENIISGLSSSVQPPDGKDGFDGKHGNLNEFALDGLNGATGNKGINGINGEKSFILGSKGSSGDKGRRGIHGKLGISGLKGIPSNASIPYITYANENDQNNVPLIYEQHFSYNDQLYKLTASFIFDEITHFSFQNGINNSVSVIDTSSGFANVTIPNVSNPGKVKKIFSTIRIILEDTKDSSTIFYTSAPISKDSYILVSSESLSDSKANTNILEEILVDKYREFGLDFDLIPYSTGPKYIYNYTVGGISTYRVIFNIDPPLPKCVARIEENYSSEEIKDFYVPKIKHPSKDGIIKIKAKPPKDSIYMLSQAFPFGKVVFKDLSFNNGLWRLQKFNSLSDSLNDSFPLLIKGLNDLEKNNLSFKNDYQKATTIVLTDKIGPGAIFQNILFTFKLDMGAPFSSNITAAQFNFESEIPLIPPPTPPPSGKYVKHDSFSTKMTLNNLQLSYSNISPSLTFPSRLNNSFFYLFFIVKVNKKDFENKKYSVKVNDDNNQLILNTLFDETVNNLIKVIPENEYIYYPVKINLYNKINFNNLFGKRIILKLSMTTLDFESHFGKTSDYDNRLLLGTSDFKHRERRNTVQAFEGTNTKYDFDPGHPDECKYFDFLFSATKFQVEANTFLVGYEQIIGQSKYQKVLGTRLSNGDYYMDIPINGY